MTDVQTKRLAELKGIDVKDQTEAEKQELAQLKKVEANTGN